MIFHIWSVLNIFLFGSRFRKCDSVNRFVICTWIRATHESSKVFWTEESLKSLRPPAGLTNAAARNGPSPKVRWRTYTRGRPEQKRKNRETYVGRKNSGGSYKPRCAFRNVCGSPTNSPAVFRARNEYVVVASEFRPRDRRPPSPITLGAVASRNGAFPVRQTEKKSRSSTDRITYSRLVRHALTARRVRVNDTVFGLVLRHETL